MRSYSLGAGPITYQSFDERNKKDKEKVPEAEKDKDNSDDSDASLKDMKLAFEYTKVEFSMTFANYDAALKQAVLLYHSQISGQQQGERIFDPASDSGYTGFLETLSSLEKLELTKRAMSTLLGATVQ
jgi:hypothetical protein